jgi:hypothetical protein
LAFPSGYALLSASGAAFTAVVAGQMASAFACRSASLWPGKLGWFSNRYLVIAIFCEAAMLIGFLYISPLAKILGQAAPNTAGYVMALLAIPAVLAADAVQKRWKGRRSRLVPNLVQKSQENGFKARRSTSRDDQKV